MANQRAFGFNVYALSKGLDQVGREVTKLGKTLDDFNRKTAKATVDVDTRAADAKIGKFARDLHQRVERAVRNLPEVQLNADSSPVDRRIAAIRRELATLSSKRIGVDIDAGQAQAQVQRLSSELSRLARQSPNVQVRADTAAASTALLGVSALAGRLDGRNVAITVDAAGVSRAISLLGLLTAGLAAASAMAGPAVAGLAAIGPMAGTAAQGIGALAAGFSGVGDAVTALGDAETKAAAGTAVSAASRVNSAQAIEGAQIAVQRATEQADRAAIQGAQQVADAREALADAQRTAARQVEQAEDALARAHRDVADSQRDLLRSQQDLTRSQRELTQARSDAVEEIEDLDRALRGAALSEREAALRLAEAQAELESARTGQVYGADLQRLELDAERAALALEEATDRHGDLRKESEQSARAGVEGSDRVVSAQERVVAAQERVADAQRRAVDATTGVRDAELELVRTREDSSRRVEAAQDRIARAQQQAAWAQRDAAASVADAQRALANAYTDTGTQGAASLNKVKEAMEGLSPEAQRFAHFLHGEVIPGLHGIRDAVQATLLPRMETALRNMGKLAPVVSAGLAETGRVIGDLSVRGSEMMSSGPWQRDFATIMASNNRTMGSFGSAGLAVADAFRSITVASLPLTERFARFAAKAGLAFDSFITGARASGELDRWFAQMSDTLAELGAIVGQIITGLFDLTQALGPLGMILLRTVGVLVELIGQLAEINPMLTQVAASALIGVAAFNLIGKAVVGATLAAGVATSGWKMLGGVLSGLAPSAIAGTAAMQKVAAGLNAAELAAGRYTGRLLTSTSAAERAATKGATLGTTVTRIASALPVAGLAVAGMAIAWDALTTSAGEAADAMVRGGAAAQQAATKMAAQGAAADAVANSGLPLLVRGLANMVDGLDEASAKTQELYNRLTPLEQAQTLAATAAYRYGEAVKAHGPTSWQAATASGALAVATDRVEQEQRQAEEATKSWTDKLIEQRDTMLGSIDAEIRYEAAVDALTESIAANGATLDLNTASGRANMGALQELSKAAIGHLQAMADQGAGLDQITAKERHYRDHLFNTAIQAGMTRDAARRYVDQLHLTPQNISTAVHLDTGPASRALRDWIRSAQGQQVVLNVSARTTGNILTAPGRASGGPIRGPGTSTSDSILARLSDNEHVWSAREVRGAGGHHRVASLRSAAASGQLPRFAGGGAVRALPGFAAGGAPAAATVGGDVFGPLTESADELTEAGLQPLAAELTKTTVPALELVQRHAERDTPDAIRSLTGTTQASSATMGASWAQLGQLLTATTAGMTRDMAYWQGRSNASWQDISVRAGATIGHMTGPQFGALHRGMDLVQGHSSNMANWVGGQFHRIQGLTANPIRWALNHPINRGLVGAWNAIDRFFALGRPMGGVPVGFAAGGRIAGGVPGKDSVPIMAMEDEFVVRREIARPTRHFLEALNAGQPEAIQAAGGRYAKFAAGGPVERGLGFARAQHGKPYIWGGVGPRGYDCSGLISAIANTLMGRNPHQRIGTTGTAPWSGWSRGLNSSFGVGFFKGNPGHMAGTLAGANVEAGGSPSMTKFIQGAAGARSGQFTGHMSLPQVGGRFIGGGDDGIDVGAYVRGQMAPALRMVADVTRFFGPGNAAVAAQALARRSIDGAISWAVGNIAGGGTAGSGPVRAQVQGVSRRFGWGGGAQWSALDRLIQKESSWNPLAQNPRSTAFGLYQFLDCVPLDTEILTRDGWKRYNDVCPGDQTIGYNPGTGQSEWTTILDVVVKPAQRVVHIGSDRWAARVTPGHRWWSTRRTPVPVREDFSACPDCGATGTKRGAFTSPRSLRVHRAKVHSVETRDVPHHRVGEFTRTDSLTAAHDLLLSAPADTGVGLPISDDEARILGWIAGDGHIHGDVDGTLSVTIYQSKPDRIAELRELLADVPHSEYSRQRAAHHLRAHSFYLHAAYARELIKRSGWIADGPEAFILDCSPSQRAAWLAGIIAAEGAYADGIDQAMRIPQNDGPIAEAIVLAVYLDGHRPSRRRRGVRSGFSQVTLSRPGQHAGMLRILGETDEPVWCVRTRLGTWTMRQDEQVSLTGNSTWATVGGHKTSNPGLQAEYGNRYIKGRYGDPVGALSFHGRNNWYDGGGLARGPGWLFKGPRPERMLSGRQTEAFERLVSVLSTHRGMTPLVLSAPQQAQVQGAVRMAGPELAVLGRVIEQAMARAMPTLDGLKLQLVDDGRHGAARIVRRQERSLARQG